MSVDGSDLFIGDLSRPLEILDAEICSLEVSNDGEETVWNFLLERDSRRYRNTC